MRQSNAKSVHHQLIEELKAHMLQIIVNQYNHSSQQPTRMANHGTIQDLIWWQLVRFGKIIQVSYNVKTVIPGPVVGFKNSRLSCLSRLRKHTICPITSSFHLVEFISIMRIPLFYFLSVSQLHFFLYDKLTVFFCSRAYKFSLCLFF